MNKARYKKIITKAQEKWRKDIKIKLSLKIRAMYIFTWRVKQLISSFVFDAILLAKIINVSELKINTSETKSFTNSWEPKIFRVLKIPMSHLQVLDWRK